MIVDNLSFKMIHKEELINLGNVEFIKKYFNLNDEKIMNEIIFNLYNDLSYDELYDLLINLKEKFLKKLYEFKNELKLNNVDFLLFKQIILSNEMDHTIKSDLISARFFIEDLHQKINDVINKENINIEHINDNFIEISNSIEKGLRYLERIII